MTSFQSQAKQRADALSRILANGWPDRTRTEDSKIIEAYLLDFYNLGRRDAYLDAAEIFQRNDDYYDCGEDFLLKAAEVLKAKAEK